MLAQYFGDTLYVLSTKSLLTTPTSFKTISAAFSGCVLIKLEASSWALRKSIINSGDSLINSSFTTIP